MDVLIISAIAFWVVAISFAGIAIAVIIDTISQWKVNERWLKLNGKHRKNR